MEVSLHALPSMHTVFGRVLELKTDIFLGHGKNLRTYYPTLFRRHVKLNLHSWFRFWNKLKNQMYLLLPYWLIYEKRQKGREEKNESFRRNENWDCNFWTVNKNRNLFLTFTVRWHGHRKIFYFFEGKKKLKNQNLKESKPNNFGNNF